MTRFFVSKNNKCLESNFKWAYLCEFLSPVELRNVCLGPNMKLLENRQIFVIFGLFKPKMTFLVILASICLILGLYEVPKNGQKTLYTALDDLFFYPILKVGYISYLPCIQLLDIILTHEMPSTVQIWSFFRPFLPIFAKNVNFANKNGLKYYF